MRSLWRKNRHPWTTKAYFAAVVASRSTEHSFFWSQSLVPEKEALSSPQNSPEPQGLLYILLSAFAFLLGWSFSKLSTPEEKSDNSRAAKAEPDKKNSGTRNFPLPMKVSPIPPESDNSCKCCHHKTPWWKITLEIATFLAAVVYAGITYRMWREMQGTNTISSQALRIDQRAWVAVSNISPELQQNGDWTVSLVFKNTGKTPARNFVIKGTGEAVVKGQKPSSEEVKLPGRGVIAPDGIFHSNLSISALYDWKSVNVILHGRIEYDSVFGNSHWTQFCYYFVPDNKTGKGGSAPCETGNDTDNGPP